MAPSKQTKPAAVVWDRRGMKNLHLIPENIDAFVRAQIAEQVAQSPGTVYVPVSWEDTQAIHHAPGPSSTGLMDAPFIGGITFIRIAHRPNTPATNAPQAGVVLKDPKNVIGLTPGHTVTPCKLKADNSQLLFLSCSFSQAACSFQPPFCHPILSRGL